MSRPFVDEDEHYHPEAIAVFVILVLFGFLMGVMTSCLYRIWS